VFRRIDLEEEGGVGCGETIGAIDVPAVYAGDVSDAGFSVALKSVMKDGGKGIRFFR
jgi:hypothetical protein